MLKYLKKYWLWCILAPLCMIGEVLVDLFQPNLMNQIVDDGVIGENLNLIINIGLKMLVIIFFGIIAGVLSNLFTNLASQNFANDLRKDLFKKIVNLPYEQTDDFTTGSLVTRLSNDVTQVQSLVSLSIRSLIRTTCFFVGGIIMLSFISLKFAIIVGCCMPVTFVVVLFFLKKTSPLFGEVQTKLDDLNNVMQEDVAGHRVIKAYVKEEYEQNRFDKANEELCNKNLKVQETLAFMSPILNILMNMCFIAIIYIGGIEVKNGGGLTAGNIMASISYITLILHGVVFLANMFQTVTRAKASSARIKAVLNCESPINNGNVKNGIGKGIIEFKNISFSYPDGNQNVLNNINLKIDSGETIGILGTTGSGKTSLINLIPRFYEATNGEILVDGVNVKDYDLNVLRNKITVVPQTAELYSRTILDNIKWGSENKSDEEAYKASEIAQAAEFITTQENGYDTIVAEKGRSLSGGQKQRISIARAILRDSEVIIFDDSTSALDLKTEANFYKALNENKKDLTKIIIAQRISTVKNADKIIVLDHGSISDIGNHEYLLKNSKIYQDIYNLQLGGNE